MTYRVSIEKNGLQTHAGTLTGDRPENTVFAYAPEYLAAEGAAPISLSLPAGGCLLAHADKELF